MHGSQRSGMIRRCSTSLAALLALALPAAAPMPVWAQAYQCRAPAIRSVPAIAPDGPRREMPVTGYTLALSWSPEFCRFREGQRAHRFQCSRDNGLFGLVVHGLWPEGPRGRWPQWCATPAKPTPAELAAQMCVMPSARLAARQWAKHGACMAKRPATYYRVTRILLSGLRLPDYDRISREDGLTAGRIRGAFAEANRGWSSAAVGVKLDEGGWLEEIRLCYDRGFRPKRCDARRFGAKDDAPARIWRGL
ncbi:MAG: ribonuclease T [Erythrobacter sp.]|nr:MAG: ribonuclease T [Erythrobacter sp.]